MKGKFYIYCPRRRELVAADKWLPRPMVQLDLFFNIDPDAEQAAEMRELMEGIRT
jgi:hypothetical protein